MKLTVWFLVCSSALVIWAQYSRTARGPPGARGPIVPSFFNIENAKRVAGAPGFPAGPPQLRSPERSESEMAFSKKNLDIVNRADAMIDHLENGKSRRRSKIGREYRPLDFCLHSLLWLDLVPGLIKPAPCYARGNRTDQYS